MSANPFYGFDDFAETIKGLPLSSKPLESEIIREQEQVTFARKHSGVISASKVATLATYQPCPETIAALELEIEELDFKISSSKTGKTKTAEALRESKQKQLNRMINDELPEGAVKWCTRLAMARITGFFEESDVGFENNATRWGKLCEPLAVEVLRERYPLIDFRFVNDKQEFILLNGFDYVGATPDGVIFESTLGMAYGKDVFVDKPKAALDIKCPLERDYHREYKNIKSIKQFKQDCPVYYWQGVLQAMCLNVDLFLFASFDKRHPKKENQLFVHEFFIPNEDKEFLLSRIIKAEKLIESIINEFE